MSLFGSPATIPLSRSTADLSLLMELI